MNTIKNLLEFQMLMLENVYEDDLVFRKELKKSKIWLNSNDLITLNPTCKFTPKKAGDQKKE